ncbi:MAG TPA: hypothetical protein VD965_08415 [Burkholderiales bacterium]|nr:hypothetical protein [Burkholderiales bacterium]
MPGIRFEFHKPQTPPLEAGPYEAVEFSYDRMFANGDFLAKESDNRWEYQGERYASVQFTVPVDICFMTKGGRSRVLGPYGDFKVVDGVAYASGHVFAFVDQERKDWYSYDLGRHFERMLIAKASDR